MNTALTIFDASDIACLDPENEAMEAFIENVQEEGFQFGDLERITVPSQGQTEWVTRDISGKNIYVSELTGIPIVIQKQGVLWAKEEMDGSGDRPLLTSHDLITARNESDVEFPEDMKETIEAARCGEDDKGPIYSWLDLEYAKYETAKNGKGKRVKESRIVFLLPIDGVLPVVVSIPGASIKDFRSFVVKLPCSKHRCVISLGLEADVNAAGIDFSRVVPRFEGQISKEDGEKIKKTYSSMIGAIIPVFDNNAALTAEGATQAQIASTPSAPIEPVDQPADEPVAS